MHITAGHVCVTFQLMTVAKSPLHSLTLEMRRGGFAVPRCRAVQTEEPGLSRCTVPYGKDLMSAS
jgi:hypothetical protein